MEGTRQTPTKKLTPTTTEGASQTLTKKLMQTIITEGTRQTQTKKLTPEKIQVNITKRDNRTLTNRVVERDTSKCKQTFIKNPPHNSFIRSHGESYEDFLSNHINFYKDLISMRTSCYNIEHNTSPSLENNEDKNQDNFLVKAKQPKEKHKSYINYKTVTFWNQDYKKTPMNKNTNKLGQK